MKHLILSLVTLSSLTFCLNVQATDRDPKAGDKQEKPKNKDDKDTLRPTLIAFVVSGAVIWAVEQGGEIIGLDQSIRKSVELMTVIGATGWAMKNRALMEAAVKVPLVLGTTKIASSGPFQDILTKMPLFGESLRNMGHDLKGLASVATYVVITLPGYEMLRENYVDPYLGLDKQKH